MRPSYRSHSSKSHGAKKFRRQAGRTKAANMMSGVRRGGMRF